MKDIVREMIRSRSSMIRQGRLDRFYGTAVWFRRSSKMWRC